MTVRSFKSLEEEESLTISLPLLLRHQSTPQASTVAQLHAAMLLDFWDARNAYAAQRWAEMPFHFREVPAFPPQERPVEEGLHFECGMGHACDDKWILVEDEWSTARFHCLLCSVVSCRGCLAQHARTHTETESDATSVRDVWQVWLDESDRFWMSDEESEEDSQHESELSLDSASCGADVVRIWRCCHCDGPFLDQGSMLQHAKCCL